MKFRAAKVQSNWENVQKKKKKLQNQKKDFLDSPYFAIGKRRPSGKSYLFTGDQAILARWYFKKNYNTIKLKTCTPLPV